MSSSGSAFYVAFLLALDPLNSAENTLFIYSDVTTKVNVTIPALESVTEYDVTAGQRTTVTVQRNLRLTEMKIENKGILLSSADDFSVIGINRQKASADSFAAIPGRHLGTEYYVLSYFPVFHSLAGIVATEDATVVTITLRTTGILTIDMHQYTNGNNITLVLNRLQTYQLAHNADLSGTKITSSKPIALFSGNSCAFVPSTIFACDHLVEQVPPLAEWGYFYIVAPLATRSAGDIVRVMTSMSNTDVTFEERNVTTMQAGDVYDYETASNKSIVIRCTKRCLVTQFSKGAFSDLNLNADPFMTTLLHKEQYGDNFIFSTPDPFGGGDYNTYVNILVQFKASSGIILDGNVLPDNTTWIPVFGTSYVTSAVHVTPGFHVLRHAQGIVFGAHAYGFYNGESYGHPLWRYGGPSSVCVTSSDDVADGRDNDCDGRVDEEYWNNLDDDNDGLIDEDLFSPIPYISVPSLPVNLLGCFDDPDDVSYDGAGVNISVYPQCIATKNLKVQFVDFKITNHNLTGRTLHREWAMRDSCNNVATANQTITITYPDVNVTFPADKFVNCTAVYDVTLTGVAQVAACGSHNVTVRREDSVNKGNACHAGVDVIHRTWMLRDVQGGLSSTHVQTIHVIQPGKT